jgi:hypothetical protein
MPITTHYFAQTFHIKNGMPMVLVTIDQMERETPFTVLQGYIPAQDTWARIDLEGIRATAIAYDEDAKGPLMWITGDTGDIWKMQSSKIASKGQLPDSGFDGRQLGQPNDVRRIAGQMYVCGFAGQVYTLVKDQWVHMDAGLAEATGNPDSIDLESIDGTAANDIYTCGSGGLIAHWDGKAWTKLPVLTNVYLASVRCYAKDRIVVVGNNGVVIESDGKSWKIDRIPGAEDTPLSDSVMYKERLYVGALGKLYVKNADAWVEVKTGLPKDKTQFIRLMVGGDRLWTMGATRLNSFDGKVWKAHPDQNNH